MFTFQFFENQQYHVYIPILSALSLVIMMWPGGIRWGNQDMPDISYEGKIKTKNFIFFPIQCTLYGEGARC